MSTGARAMSTALVLEADGRRGEGRWKRGSVDNIDSNISGQAWRDRLKEAGIILDYLPDLAPEVVSGADSPLTALVRQRSALSTPGPPAANTRWRHTSDTSSRDGWPGTYTADGRRAPDPDRAGARSRTLRAVGWPNRCGSRLGRRSWLDGSQPDRRTRYMLAAVDLRLLKLACPGDGRIVSVLFSTGRDNIQYIVPATEVSRQPWPPDPTNANYGERCPCDESQDRLVGASVDFLTEMILLTDVTEDTYVLRYLESARSVIELEATREGFHMHRDSSSGTDTYNRPNHKVIVGYDEHGEVEHVHVQPETASYPPTFRGALDAITGSS
jgi:hypothetical protein